MEAEAGAHTVKVVLGVSARLRRNQTYSENRASTSGRGFLDTGRPS